MVAARLSAPKINSPASGVFRGDARGLLALLPAGQPLFNAVITSPPYWDLQNYGEMRQIGFGQSAEAYLADMRSVFQACAEVTTGDATMWLVVGFLRREHRIMMLPGLLTEEATKAGWIPREWVTWEKQKSLPYARHGELRDITEHAVLLSKTDTHAFHVGSLLDPVPTSTWWERYPERYSPRGRRPTNSWSIPIPTQGAWKEGPDHACPFPAELTFRLLSLVTQPDDWVLDPFAGVGSVPALAEAMGRKSVGIELKQAYVNRYPQTLASSIEWWGEKCDRLEKQEGQRKLFAETIMKLRALKFARVLALELNALFGSVCWISVTGSALRPSQPYADQVIEVEIATTSAEAPVLAAALEAIERRPLSKFGIEPIFSVRPPDASKVTGLWYVHGKFWKEPLERFPGASLIPHVVAPFVPDVKTIRSWHGVE